MPTLEDMLRASLKGANERFELANKALHSAVAEAAKAVEAVTGGKATLQLVEHGKRETGSRFDFVVTAESQQRPLATFDVPNSGFPIRRLHDEGGFAESFPSAAALASYFQKLASDQDSPLVAHLAYIVRNASPDEGPIPF
ncbi:MAG: hypothetical protein C0467_26735 [Planctomycetaceae bacterium]|nr:hypothetical protein [Planctomycetaceae bacterium]